MTSVTFRGYYSYGFISSNGHEEDIFVHYRNIRGDGYRSLIEGQPVEFSLAEGEKGLQAEDVMTV